LKRVCGVRTICHWISRYPRPATRFPRPGSLAERLAGGLRAEILHGQLEPVDRPIENELVLRSGVSLVPLREAFRPLTQEGLAAIGRIIDIATPIQCQNISAAAGYDPDRWE
jgi:hypothetical protein